MSTAGLTPKSETDDPLPTCAICFGGGKGWDIFSVQAWERAERDAAERLGKLFGTEWPTSGEEKLISFPYLSQKQQELPDQDQEALVNQ